MGPIGTSSVGGADLAVVFDGVTKRYGSVLAVDDLSFAVDSGEILGIAGESGSGKTMTAMSLFGLLPHGARVTGSIRLNGDSLSLWPTADIKNLLAQAVRMAVEIQPVQLEEMQLLAS